MNRVRDDVHSQVFFINEENVQRVKAFLLNACSWILGIDLNMDSDLGWINCPAWETRMSSRYAEVRQAVGEVKDVIRGMVSIVRYADREYYRDMQRRNVTRARATQTRCASDNV